METDRTGIFVGTVVDSEHLKAFASVIECIFRSGFDNRMEQETIRCALRTLTDSLKVSNITVGNNTINIGDSYDR